MQKSDISKDIDRSSLRDLAGKMKEISHHLIALAGTLLADENGKLFPSAMDEKQRCVRLAERMFRNRRVRSRFFAPSLFGEPAWDILLDLYLSSHRGRPVFTTEAAFAAEIPPTTSLRWLQVLEAEGLLERLPDPNDRRRVYIRLSPDGEQAMTSYLIKLVSDAR